MEEEYEEGVRFLKTEWQKRNKNHHEIRRMMEATRRRRREWIMEERPHTTEVQAQFPPLRKKQYVSFNKTAVAQHDCWIVLMVYFLQLMTEFLGNVTLWRIGTCGWQTL